VSGPANCGPDPLPFQDMSGTADVTWINFAQTTADRIIVSYKWGHMLNWLEERTGPP